MNRDWVLSHLREAHDELRRTIAEIESKADYGQGELGGEDHRNLRRPDGRSDEGVEVFHSRWGRHHGWVLSGYMFGLRI